MNINILIFLLLLIPSFSFATDYYASTSPNSAFPNCIDENNTCSLSELCSSIQAGDTAFLLNGTYYLDGTGEVYLPACNVGNNGTESNPIIIKSLNYQQATITLNDGTSGPVIGQYQHNGLVLDGLKILEGNTYLADSGVVSFRGCEYGKIKNCEVVGLHRNEMDNHSGIRAEDASNIEVINCYIHDFLNETQSNAHNNCGTLIYSVDNFIVTKCTISNCNLGSYDKRDGNGSAYTFNFYFQNNKHVFLQSTAGYDHNVNNSINNNIFVLGGDEGGIEIGINSDNALIYNNTFSAVNSTVTDYAAISSTQSSITNLSVFNNIISSCNKNIRIISTDTVGYFNYNQYYDSGTDPFVINWTAQDFDTWKINTGFDGNSIITDPNFINPGGAEPNDYKRTSYPTDGRGGEYPDVIGAYVTGNEQIGYQSGGVANCPDYNGDQSECEANGCVYCSADDSCNNTECCGDDPNQCQDQTSCESAGWHWCDGACQSTPCAPAGNTASLVTGGTASISTGGTASIVIQ